MGGEGDTSLRQGGKKKEVAAPEHRTKRRWIEFLQSFPLGYLCCCLIWLLLPLSPLSGLFALVLTCKREGGREGGRGEERDREVHLHIGDSNRRQGRHYSCRSVPWDASGMLSDAGDAGDAGDAHRVSRSQGEMLKFWKILRDGQGWPGILGIPRPLGMLGMLGMSRLLTE